VARRRSHAAHGKIVTLIEAGNIDGVARLVRGHLEQSVFYSRSTDAAETIRAHALKPTTAMRGPVHP
jgi:DNA-binding GntR family transcriptional regulator